MATEKKVFITLTESQAEMIVQALLERADGFESGNGRTANDFRNVVSVLTKQMYVVEDTSEKEDLNALLVP